MLSSSASAMQRRRELIARMSLPRVDDAPARAIEWEQPRHWAAEAPELHTWLRRYAGQSTYRLEQASEALEAALEDGSGFADRDVLEYAYLVLRADRSSTALEPTVTPFDDPPEEAPMAENGRRHWRIKDICEQYDVSRVTVDAWRKLDGFPEPIIDSPPVWNAGDVERWRSRQLSTDRKRRREALTIAGTGDLERAASAAGVTTRTIRRWIEQAAREESND